MDVITIDFETTVRNKGEDAVGKMKADPIHPDNEVCYYASKIGEYDTEFINHTIVKGADFWNRTDCLYVLHNMKFDLKYLRKKLGKEKFNDFILKNKFWDTQYVEYLLSGQEWIMPALGSKRDLGGYITKPGVSVTRGGTDEKDEMKAYWDSGTETEDIPRSVAEPYTISDVDNTYKVFKSQLKEVMDKGLQSLVQMEMEAILATLEMEYNGMAFDSTKATLESVKLDKTVNILKNRLELMMKDSFGGETKAKITVDSPKQVSKYIWGGEVDCVRKVKQYDDKGNVVRFKSGVNKGAIKLKNEYYTKTVVGKPTLLNKDAYSTGGDQYMTDDDSLNKYTEGALDMDLISFCNDLKEYRALSKELKTYFIGYNKLVWGHDDCIHTTIHHCTTITGRNSSANPNLQNVSGKGVD